MIAIVIPYYKKKFFKRTLESLANQTDKRFNVYIGNDASPEDPSNLIEEYADKFNLKYKHFDKNVGGVSLVQQWNRCIELSKDEDWIIILGDDDYFGPNVVEAFYKHSEEFLEKANVVRYARQNINHEDDITLEVQHNPKWETAADSYYRRITGQTISTLSEYVFRREVYEKYGFHDYPLAWQSDNRAWIEFSDGKPIFSINNAVVSVIRSIDSISGSDLYSVQKRKANLSFYKYLITDKLQMFNKVQAIRVLHKYENEIKHDAEVPIRQHLFLFPYYLKNYNRKAFNKFLRKMTKSVLFLK